MFRMKSDTKDLGTVYYMNVCCITEQGECAKTFSSKAEAQIKDLTYFENLLQRIEHSEIIFEEC